MRRTSSTSLLTTITVCCTLTACGLLGLSAEQAEALALHQRNAKTYWEGGNLDQAMDQVRRGLEIDPYDYNLRSIRAWCWLRRSQNEPNTLDRAIAEFDEVLDLRSDSTQAAFARLGYSEAHGKAGLAAMRKASDAREEADRLPEGDDRRAVLEAEVLESETIAREEFTLAEEQLRRLVERGESLLLAHYNLMNVRWWQGDYNGAIEHGHSFIARADELSAQKRRELERTSVVEYERRMRNELQDLIVDEVRVRSFMANLHYKRGHHELVVQQLDEVLLKMPNLYNEYYNRARSLLAMGRIDEARRDFEKFLATSGLPRESTQIRDALRHLRGL